MEVEIVVVELLDLVEVVLVVMHQEVLHIKAQVQEVQILVAAVVVQVDVANLVMLVELVDQE